MFTGDHSDVTGDCFTIGETAWISEKHFGGQRGNRSYARMSHQPKREWSLFSLSLDLAVQMVNGVLKLRIQRQQRIALVGGIWSQGQSTKAVLASWGPERAAATQPVTERQRLQAELYAGSDAHELMAVSQEHLQIAVFPGRYPNRGKTLFRQ